MAPQAEAQSQVLHYDPNGPGMGLDIDFGNFDSDVANLGFSTNIDFKFDDLDYSANFNFEHTLKEAESSLEPHKTFQETNADMNSPCHLKLANGNSDELTHTEASYGSYPGTSTSQEPFHLNEMRGQKRKKMDEVDEGHILPEGSRRNRNKTARARGLD